MVGAIIFGLIATMGCVTSYTPVKPINPIYEDKTYPAGYVGNVTGSIHVQVMIVDGLDEQRIIDALQYVPQWINFEIIPDDPKLYMIETEGEYKGMHVPMRDNMIVVFDATKQPDMKPIGAAFIDSGNGMRCGIGVNPSDTSMVIGMRVFHEMLHSIGNNGDADEMNTNASYKIYGSQEIFDQYRYYGYLEATYRGE